MPASWLLWAGAGLGLAVLSLGARLGRIATLAGAFVLGFAWAGLMAQWRLADMLPEGSEGRDISISGIVAAMPQRFENGWRFEFETEQASLPVPHRLSLAWYQSPLLDDEDVADAARAPALHAGERWRFTVRLKRPHGNLNPHGFDYEGWLFEQGIRATGYVRPKASYQRLDAFVPSFRSAIERLRENIRGRFQAMLPDAPYVGILVALAVGDQRAIDPGQWQVFARTGLTHLLSVSGLHITMVAGLAYALVNALWRRSRRLPLRWPAQQAAALGGMLAALAYCLLAGFAVPAQRTLYMLGVVGLALIVRRTLATRRVLAAALGLVLLLDPWAVTAAGFWLSFGAVALLFYIGAGRLGEAHWLHGWGRAQWAMTAGMVPLMLALFQQFSLVSPLANAVAIPLVSFVVTPLTLLAAVPGLEFLLLPAHALTAWMMAGVDWLAVLPWAVWQQQAPPPWALASGLLGSAWLLAPRGFPARWVGAALFLPLLWLPPDRPPHGAARITVLDVGQGLAVHVQTASHDLLFDTGPAFSPDANSGNRIIAPYLRALGVQRLDTLVVSHVDKDHSGGAESILEALPVDELLSSLPGIPFAAQSPLHRHCTDGQAWQWDGVRFSMLHPQTERYSNPTRKSNDMSCVLKVETDFGGALIPSDIEAVSETALLARHRRELGADLLLAPHHGSRTSSGEDFIAAVGARQVVFAAGYRNRFGHPKDEVVQRYRASGAALYRSDRDGALRFDLASGGIQVVAEREATRRYWQGR
ncbi:MAG: DNA internalization-related competence protein ComEC/Rec2 [Rhodocyclaceae bacterium]|nr:DNA internalization-related competence protein ComEC/Rec2 [Rhodocyclaceae bacterium]